MKAACLTNGTVKSKPKQLHPIETMRSSELIVEITYKQLMSKKTNVSATFVDFLHLYDMDDRFNLTVFNHCEFRQHCAVNI